MTMRDLANYRALVQEPLQFEYRSKKVLAPPPPASGHVLSLVLQLLDNFDLSSRDATAWSQILEAFRFGYAMMSQTGDREFSDKTKWVVEKVQNGTWAEEIIRDHVKKNKNQFKGPYDDKEKYKKNGPLYENSGRGHTTHVSVLGPDGSGVSCTSSVDLYFGSRIMTDDGIILNDSMVDFSTPGTTKNFFGFPGAPENFIVPGKRSLSSISASIVVDDKGKARFVSGAAGGPMIITSTVLSMINALDWDMTLDENINAKRIHDQLGNGTRYETGLDETLVEELTDMGYTMFENVHFIAVMSIVSSLRNETEASGDPRKQGSGRVIKM
jgi:gamma-glutamyltranspeptidase/glutathione hydrolase/leukotriene-C4 hydrolase